MQTSPQPTTLQNPLTPIPMMPQQGSGVFMPQGGMMPQQFGSGTLPTQPMMLPQTGMMPMMPQTGMMPMMPQTGMMPMMPQTGMMMPQTGMMMSQTGMMPMMPQTGMMMMPPQTGMMPMMPQTGMMMPQMMMPQMMPQQQQQTTVVEDKKKKAPAPVQEEEESPFDREKEDIKVTGKSHNKVPLISVRRLTIVVEANGKLDITQAEADFVSIEIQKKGQVRINHLTARRLEVAISGEGFCKIGGPGAATSTAMEQQIKVSERGVFDGRLCRGKNIIKNITGRGKAAVCETDGLRIVKKK